MYTNFCLQTYSLIKWTAFLDKWLILGLWQSLWDDPEIFCLSWNRKTIWVRSGITRGKERDERTEDEERRVRGEREREKRNKRKNNGNYVKQV